jgi:hypothetical protein
MDGASSPLKKHVIVFVARWSFGLFCESFAGVILAMFEGCFSFICCEQRRRMAAVGAPGNGQFNDFVFYY